MSMTLDVDAHSENQGNFSSLTPKDIWKPLGSLPGITEPARKKKVVTENNIVQKLQQNV